MNWIYQKTLKCSSPKNCKIYLFWNLFCSLTIVAKMVKRYRAEMQTAANWIQKWLLIAQRIVLLLRKDFYSFSSKIYALAGKQGCSVRLNPCPLSRTPRPCFRSSFSEQIYWGASVSKRKTSWSYKIVIKFNFLEKNR